ncbi:MAG TPA: hypothetical protein ENJ99_06925 [Rhizobiales bacterium]|nr:hypothetical protein [Hyphomicrobiales bacterium]
MENNLIVKAQWHDFFENLSEKFEVEDILAAVQCDRKGAETRLEEAHLLALDFDKKACCLNVSLMGDDMVIEGLKSVSADFDGDELSGLEVKDAGGCTYVIRFTHPIHTPRAALAA